MPNETRLFQRLLEQLGFKRRPVQRLAITSRYLLRIHDVRRLLKLTTRILVRCLNASHATIYLREPGTNRYYLAASYGPSSPGTIHQVDDTSPLVKWLAEHRQALQPSDCVRQPTNGSSFLRRSDPYKRLGFVMDNFHAQLIVPSFQRGKLLGFLVLGEKLGNREKPYTDTEISILFQLAHDCAIALENAQSYEQLKTTAKKLQSTQEKLVRQERMVAAGRFAMGLAHEIKNPLAAIKTFVEYLPERHDDPLFRTEFTKIVGKEIDRINAIVQSLSDFAKPVLLRVETVDIQQVVKDTLTLLSNDCLKRNVNLKTSFESEAILLPADPNQMKQALLNLCMNALDAMEKGGTLSVSCQHQEPQTIIQIADTGCGIATEHLPHLFDPFFTTKNTGMGLGLAVVKQIVDQHLGTIHVESHVGIGSSFEIRLPLAVKFRAHSSSSKREGDSSTVELDQIEGVRLNLLVVDDEPKIRVLLKQAFETKGCRVRTASSGEEGLELVAKEMPQVLILDLQLEAMDGFAVLEQVRRRYPNLPVVIITGAYGPEVDKEVERLGAAACLHKPTDLVSLEQVIFDLAARLPNQSE